MASPDIWPQLTLAIPVYNRQDRVCDTLDSIAAQSMLPGCLIIIDNNSSDNSLQTIRDWAERNNALGWRIVIDSEYTPGAAAARRRASDLADTEWIMFFDSDDIMGRRHIESVFALHQANPDASLLVWPVNMNFSNGRRITRYLNRKNIILNHLVQGLLSTQAYAVRKRLLDSAGNWNVKMLAWDDWELGLRLLLASPQIAIDTQSEVEMMCHEDSITGIGYGHSRGKWEEALDTMQDLMQGSEYPQKDYILRLLAYRRAILAAHYHKEGFKEDAEILLRKAMDLPTLTPLQKLIIKSAYHFTSLGLPGAGRIFAPLL